MGVRATTTLGADAAIEDRVAMAVKSGGMPILITSATDALAFFFGSITVLPALSWFCVFAGFGVVLCFLFQILFFVPFLVLNERRALANRYDLSCFPLCCFKASQKLDKLCCIKPQQGNAATGKGEVAPNADAIKDDVDFHDWENPRGCCFCCKCKPGGLVAGFERFGRMITTPFGKISTLVIFLSIMVVGIIGSTQIYQDFKLEWFVPDDSYLNTFFKWNTQYFASGTPVSIYGRDDIDYFANQDKLIEMKLYMNSSKLIDQGKSISDWYGEFMETSRNNDAMRSTWLTSDNKRFKDRNTFYTELHNWYD